MSKTIVIAENRPLREPINKSDTVIMVCGKIDKPFLSNLRCNTVAINELQDAILDSFYQAVEKRDAMIVNRLRELGFDVSDLKVVAERCTIATMSNSDIFEVWIDKGLKTEKFVCYYTEPQIRDKGIFFDFGTEKEKPQSDQKK